MSSIFEDIISGRLTDTRGNTRMIKSRSSPRKGSKNNSLSADNAISLCEKCNFTWEKHHNNNNCIYYQSGTIPTYGKKRKICPKCSVNIVSATETHSKEKKSKVSKEKRESIQGSLSKKNI